MSECSRSDARLYKRAMRQGWNVPEKMRKEIIKMMQAMVTDEKATPRERNAAARLLVQASRVELDAIRLAQSTEFHDFNRRLQALEDHDAGLAGAADGP
jgi:hypothetical protein